MIDLTMGVTLLAFASGFLGWAGLLGSANELGKEGFFVLLAVALGLTLFGIGSAIYRAIHRWSQARPRFSGKLAS